MGHLPARESSVFREFLAMPGALTGWYLMTVLAAMTAVSSVRTRIAFMITALGGVTRSVLTSPHPASAGALAAVIPLLTWFAAGLLTGRDPLRRRIEDSWEVAGQAVVPRPRARVRTSPGAARLGRVG
ncbi:hypothetical protein [Streptomyces sp. NPDC086777]|uniref:hypothetical protein n=1 Tax=Streptomyces sp. NPDC086777 TaxID=3154866 RepID=UPI00344CD116